MKNSTREKLSDPIRILHLPKYEDIPDVGLYLEQTVKYINSYFEHFDGMNLTASMVSNYVKKGLVANAVKKLYYREHIAYLIFIAVAKNVLSMENLRLFISMQKQSYDAEKAEKEGTNLISINSKKGQELIDSILDKIIYKKV